MAKKNSKKSKSHSKADSKSKSKVKSKAPKSAPAEASAPSVDAGAAAGGPPAMPKFKNVAKKRLTTGKGATASEIGHSLVTLFNQGKAEEVERLWHHKKIESIEGDGTVFLGRKGIAEKNAWWYGAFEIHSAKATGPFVGATGFTVQFTMEISPRGTDQRMSSTEVGVYTVSKGKIVREEFMGMCDGQC